jgi:hypothetical protein
MFDEVELNELLILVQNHISDLRGRPLDEMLYSINSVETFIEIEQKILKLLDSEDNPQEDKQ